MEELEVLHENPKWLEKTADLLNEEWPRSKYARIHCLSQSCDDLPINLVLLSDDGHEVIGHSQLSDVDGRSKACYLEHVVVKKSLRGKGLGRKLTELTENYCIKKGLETIYLSSIDTGKFYEHLGYEYCKPIISLGVITRGQLALIEKMFGLDLGETGQKKQKTSTVPQKTTSCAPSSSVPPPPAPPPPSPPSRCANPGNECSIVNRFDPSKVSWMRKNISC